MPRTAHRGCASARLAGVAAWAFFLLGPSQPLAAQASRPAAALPGPVLAQIESQLESRDPILRGEAALQLARLQRDRDLARLIAVARDPAAEARVRGILALGFHAGSGGEVVLGTILRESQRPELERAAAALALGLFPEDLAGPGYDELLKGRVGSGFRRDRLAVSAFLLALASGRGSSRAALLRESVEDEAIRDPLVRQVALRALARTPAGLSARLVEKMLAQRDAEVRVEVLHLVAERPAGQELTAKVEKLATSDPDAAVRAAALEALIRWRRPLALELAAKAITSLDPAEAVAGLHGCLGLAGGYAREAAESVVTKCVRPELHAALLAAWRGSASAALRDHAASVASDVRREPLVRHAAAEALVETKDARARKILVDLFFDAVELGPATRLARAYLRLGCDDAFDRRLREAVTAKDRLHAPLRVAALVRAGHQDGIPLASEMLAEPRLPSEERALLIRALAHAPAPTPSRSLDLDLLERISPPLAALVR